MKDKNRKIDVMGIINLTDDSYYSASRCITPAEAAVLAGVHVREGASILDVGACSSRPGSVPVGPDAEWVRLKPALELIRREYPDVRISVDTYWSDVVVKVHDLIGDFMVNDISAGEDDPNMLVTVGRLGLEYVAMHKRGNPRTMQLLTDYNNVTEEVLEYFMFFNRKAAENGIEKWVADPGFGFAKTISQNYELLNGLGRFLEIPGDRKVLVGISRKSMVYKPLGISPEEALPATQALHLSALQNGADILRVHDVAEAVRTVSLYGLLSAY